MPKVREKKKKTREQLALDRQKAEERIFQRLVKAKKKDHVTLVFHRGNNFDGMIIFNELKKVGRLINVNKEISIDFTLEEVEDVRF